MVVIPIPTPIRAVIEAGASRTTTPASKIWTELTTLQRSFRASKPPGRNIAIQYCFMYNCLRRVMAY